MIHLTIARNCFLFLLPFVDTTPEEYLIMVCPFKFVTLTKTLFFFNLIRITQQCNLCSCDPTRLRTCGRLCSVIEILLLLFVIIFMLVRFRWSLVRLNGLNSEPPYCRAPHVLSRIFVGSQRSHSLWRRLSRCYLRKLHRQKQRLMVTFCV